MRCEFCGREMEVRVCYGLKVPVPCTCPEAVAFYEAEDRRERAEEFDRVMRKSVAMAKIPPKFRIYPEFGDGSSLYIYGEQGRGKTERACGALRKFLRDGIEEYGHNRFMQSRSARFVSVPEMLMSVRRTYDVRGESEEDVMTMYAGVGLLCLDDLGKGQMTEWAIERIYTLIDMRYRRKLPIIVTSQYDGPSLVARLTQRSDAETASAIWSRLEEMCRIGRVGGRDWRKEPKKS